MAMGSCWAAGSWTKASWKDWTWQYAIRPSTEYSGREEKAARFGGLHQRLLEDDEIILMLLKKAIEAGVFK